MLNMFEKFLVRKCIKKNGYYRFIAWLENNNNIKKDKRDLMISYSHDIYYKKIKK